MTILRFTRAFAGVAALALSAGRAARGQAQTTTYRATFATAGQSMWGPPSSPPISDFTLTLLSRTWNNSGASRSVFRVGGWDFGGAINAATTGDVGLKLQFEAPRAGTVSVNMPVDVTLGLPAANSFRAGQTITIPTSLVISEGAQITTVAPIMAVKFVGRLGLSLSAGGEICIFGCFGFSFLPSINAAAAEAELFGLRASGAGGMEYYFLGNVFGVPHVMTLEEMNTLGVAGSVDALFGEIPANRVDGSTLTASSSKDFMDLGIDLGQWYLYIHRLPIPLGLQTENRGGAQLTYETVDMSAVTTGTATQEFSFTPEVYVTLALPESVQYTVLDGETVVEQGTSERITMKVGHTLNLVFPEALRTPLEIVPTFSLTNTFSNVTSLNFTESLGLIAGIFGMSVPGFTVVPGVSLPYPCPEWDDPFKICYVNTPEVRSPAINVPEVGPLVEAILPVAEWSYQVFPTGPASTDWELEGFNIVEGTPIALDPEAPAVAVHTAFASGLVTGAGPAGTLLHTVRLENLGDVQLGAAQAADALTVALGTATIDVRGIRSRTLTVNTAFDGANDQNTLAGSDALEVEGTGTLSILLGATPGTLYAATVTSGGASPIGTAVSASAGTSFAVHSAEAFPQRVQHHGEGVLTVHVLSAPGLDAAEIHPASVRLRGVQPLDWSLQAINGHNVLMLRFDKRSVLANGSTPQGIAAGSLEAPDITAVAAAVLSQKPQDAGLSAADRLGNANGRLDVGDLRALLLGTGADAADSSAGGGTTPIQAATAAGGRVETLVLLGSWTNGTPFMAEASITVLRAGRRN